MPTYYFWVNLFFLWSQSRFCFIPILTLQCPIRVGSIPPFSLKKYDTCTWYTCNLLTNKRELLIVKKKFTKRVKWIVQHKLQRAGALSSYALSNPILKTSSSLNEVKIHLISGGDEINLEIPNTVRATLFTARYSDECREVIYFLYYNFCYNITLSYTSIDRQVLCHF